MKFTHSAFIKNTPDMREWLEGIGYKKRGDSNGNVLLAFQTCDTNEPYYISFNDIHIDHYTKDSDIDCRSNPPLFKAITAMREGTDKDQWFTDGKDWIFCEREDWEDYYSVLCCGKKEDTKSYISYLDNFRKATLNELIEHFK